MSEKVYNRARALYLRKIVPINYVEPEMVTLYLSSGESSSALARMPFDLGDHPARFRPASCKIGEAGMGAPRVI
jgi:hypothetical protein